ncbi:SMC family ATPase [Microbacterium sp. SORGH_AS_0888]|uniref:AAA family ATPase n=1 Tax=Microbacterium sp. SORGH_AS_0888 TaxID=3041791 RepID=UPI00278ACDC1|nr:SMC family ATPase [Microbacterium sp. SORGH_AS_0888]MDQ1130607.1 exonuclease SbcC [Microbacterium sp. SORGH_AS_0888]
MRLHRIELTGFGPFRETQTVDFEAFAAAGIFLIAGRTGAGKSSILDGVTFALYGGVPRYDGGEKRLRSDHCAPGDPTWVRLEFTVGDRCFRVLRAPEYERPAKRGGGTTAEPARAELSERVGGEWVGLAARPRDVGILLDEILGLNQSQFQQVILLAQNRFSQFLLSGNAERQKLLRTLFDSRRFEQYRAELDERRREAVHQLDLAGSRVGALLERAEAIAIAGAVSSDAAGAGVADRIAALERAVERAAYRAETRERERAEADAAVAAADREHARRAELARAQGELAIVRQRLRTHEDDAPAMAEAARRLGDARGAEVLWPLLSAFDRAVEEQEAARARLDAAEEAWAALRGTIDALAPETQPEEAADRLTGLLALWQTALAQERALGGLEVAHAEAAAAVRATEGELDDLSRQQEQLPAARAALDDELAARAAEAGAVEALRATRDARRQQREAAAEAERLAVAATTAESAYAAAVEGAAAAASAVAMLLRRRLDGYAGELAGGLLDGEACPVCGALEHPHPAPQGDEPVTDGQFAAAEQERDRATETERLARDAASAARLAYAAARERAGGLDLDGADRALAEAEARVADAESAAEARTRLLARRAELTAQEERLAVAVETTGAALMAARERETVARERLAFARQEVDAARGDAASVGERIRVATAARDVARTLADARAGASRRAADHAAAAERLTDALDASEFVDIDAVRAAVLDAAEVEALAARIRDHEGALTATRQRLLELELELAGRGDEPADVEASAAAVAAADAARTSAIEAERDARNLSEGLRQALVEISEAHAAVAGQTARTEAVVRLADTVAGRAPNTMKMDLETFVLAAELEEIVAAANVRLGEMSSGRYSLLHTDARLARGAASGLGIEVMDAYTGRTRPAQSLSGGETFLASLALALGLAEVVTARAGGVRLDTLFIDEGFGSLDAETLELAMRTLDELRAGGRTVGVISHVEAMQQQLPAQVRVEAVAGGASTIVQDVDATVPAAS